MGAKSHSTLRSDRFSNRIAGVRLPVDQATLTHLYRLSDDAAGRSEPEISNLKPTELHSLASL